ncbi:MAG: 5-formyltetrahydrofolate cyclo-ligase [Gammaproteobacteria bacterium]
MPSRNQLRQAIRRQRRAITLREACRCAEQLAQRISAARITANSRHIAAYLATDGEIDPMPLIQRLWQLGKRIYLPVLAPFAKNTLWFARFEQGEHLVFNRYGIPEPERRRLIKPRDLDLVFTPLVAFDRNGHRLGMGAGYYDRSFAFLGNRTRLYKPKLVGLAYEFQKQAALDVNSWDIPLDAIVTENTIYRPLK